MKDLCKTCVKRNRCPFHHPNPTAFKCVYYENVEKEDKWLRFELKEEKPKTKVYSVISKRDECELGEIKWYPSWRKYCFFGTIEFETVLSEDCMLTISIFTTELNKKHKEKRRLLREG